MARVKEIKTITKFTIGHFWATQETIDTEFMAAINAEKQQNAQAPQPTGSLQQKPVKCNDNGREDAKDIERGTNENWNKEEQVPLKPLRRKFSRTVPYETAINGGGDYECGCGEGDDSVSRTVLFCGSGRRKRLIFNEYERRRNYKRVLVSLFGKSKTFLIVLSVLS